MKNIIALIIGLALFSCGGSDEPTAIYKPSSIGTQGKIDVVMNQTLWDGRLGEIVRDKLAPLIEYYPNEEYLFDLAHATKRQFSSGSKKQKNIVEFEINDNPSLKSGMSYSTDIWASDQNMVKILGKNQQELYDVFYANSQEIQDYFMNLEIERLKINLIKDQNEAIENTLRKTHNLSLSVPSDMQLSINNETIAIMERRRLVSEKQQAPGDLQEYILIYHYPYIDKNQLTKEYLLNKRDSVVQKYFKGAAEGSYMITAPDSLVPSFANEKLFKGNYAFEIRGLYSMVNWFRGGPFVSISLVDENRGRIITMEAHIYAPKFSKRPHMSYLETMLNTLSIE